MDNINAMIVDEIKNSKYKRLLIKNNHNESKPPEHSSNNDNKEINLKYNEVKLKHQKTSLDIEAEKYIHELRIVGEYNRWSLKLIQRWLLSFYKDKFWITMSIAMLKYNFNLDPSMIQLEICKDFIEGYYMPKENKIYLCANTLTNYEKQKKFKNAIQRYVN
jgi:hypothetical protein